MTEGEQDRARRLPPGPHGLPPELVERNQRERLIAAMAEVSGERGYAESSVAEVAKCAGVSTASFYRQFKHKRECMLDSFEELFGRLLEALEDACRGEEQAEGKAQAAAMTAAALLADDPPAARLLCIEILAVGVDGVRAQHEAIDCLAGLLRDRGDDRRASPDAAWATVTAMVALVTRHVAKGESLDAAALAALAAPP